MMQQYMDIKKQYKDEILFYRIGDFYEMFFDDALTASRELDLTLTGKQCGMEERAPMCGVPFHSYESYVSRWRTRPRQRDWSSAISSGWSRRALSSRAVCCRMTKTTTLQAFF